MDQIDDERLLWCDRKSNKLEKTDGSRSKKMANYRALLRFTRKKGRIRRSSAGMKDADALASRF
jgi:hypothetical protein